MEATFHEKVLAFIEYYDDGSYIDTVQTKYIKNIMLDDINKEYYYIHGTNKMTKYNFYLCEYMLKFIYTINYYNENQHIEPTKIFITYKLIFIDLFELLLKNDVNNIKYDFTIMIIIESQYGSKLIRCIESYYYLHLLSRINPNKYKWRFEGDKQRAEYIYKKTTELQMAWILVVIRA